MRRLRWGFARFGEAWAEENPPGPHDIVVSVSDVAVEHRVPLRKFNEWLARTAGSPKEVSQRKRVRELLG